MNSQSHAGSVHLKSGGRQPLLWAALVFAAGISTGVHAWRPPAWWLVAWIVFAVSAAFLLRRRGGPAFIVGLGAMFILGAFLVQARPADSGDSGLLRFADGAEVVVTAHVIKEGTLHEDGARDVRQRLDVETEQIDKENEKFEFSSGLRISVYEPPPKNDAIQEPGVARARLFRYGERLRFPAKIYPPHNYRNPAVRLPRLSDGKRDRSRGLDQRRNRRGSSRFCRQPD